MENKIIKCPFCKRENITGLSKLPEYHYCHGCQIAWLKKIPQRKYERSYYKGKFSVFSKLFYPLGRLFYFLRNLYIHGAKKTLWIDVGAGDGNYLHTVKSTRRIGVEISDAGRKMMAEKKLETMTPQEFLASKNLKATVISFWHVLEHVDRPIDYIAAAQKNISTKGKIIIGIPNIESWEFRIFGKYWFHLAPKYHIWHFSPSGMMKILTQNGFKIDKIDYWSPEHHLAGLIQSFINYTSRTQDVLHKLIKRELQDEKLPLRGLLVSFFWLTIGLPFVIIWWVIASIAHKSGTLVLVALSKR